jgi:hypothetical protein
MTQHRPRRLDIDEGLVARAKGAATALTGEPQSFRSVAATAVDRELQHVVALLVAAGLVHRPGGRPRPRELNDTDWDALGAAAELVSADRVQLLRCCLERIAGLVRDNG